VSRFSDPATAFRAWGCAALGAALAVGFATAALTGLELRTMAAIAAAAVATFVLLAAGSAVTGGSVRLVYYHHELGILAVTWALLLLARRPPLPYLDATVLGLGGFLVLGRMGCLMAGCCHGRPAARGVRYGPAHVAQGFPPHLAGVPLLPVQALEAAGVTAIIAAGVPLAVRQEPGTALAWYVTAYGVLRFCLELLRGDAERPSWLGFSQAQWCSVLLVAGIVAAGWAGLVPAAPWSLAAGGGLVGAMLLLAAARSSPGSAHRLCSARHTAEVAGLLATTAPGMHMSTLGLRISTGAEGDVEHVTLSAAGPPLTPGQARRLARLISVLRGVRTATVVGGARAGIYHVLLAPRPFDS